MSWQAWLQFAGLVALVLARPLCSARTSHASTLAAPRRVTVSSNRYAGWSVAAVDTSGNAGRRSRVVHCG